MVYKTISFAEFIGDFSLHLGGKGLCMTVEVGWYNESKTAIGIEVYADWTWEEFYQAKQTICSILNARETPVDVVITYPEELLEWPSDTKVHLRRIAEDDSDKINKIIIVRANEIVHSMYNLLRRTAGKLTIHDKIQFAGSPDDARRLIA